MVPTVCSLPARRESSKAVLRANGDTELDIVDNGEEYPVSSGCVVPIFTDHVTYIVSQPHGVGQVISTAVL